jgi:hypothetical protein
VPRIARRVTPGGLPCQPNPRSRPRRRRVPGSEAPSLLEPTTPRTPPAPKRDQRAPVPLSATGNDVAAPASFDSQTGIYLTTAQGVRLRESDHSLRVGSRGPTVLNDHHLREKVMHFDHERFPSGSCMPGGCGSRRVQFLWHGRRSDVCRVSRRGRPDPGVRAVLHRAGFARIGGHGARHPWVRDKVLYAGGKLRSGREQHAGVLQPSPPDGLFSPMSPRPRSTSSCWTRSCYPPDCARTLTRARLVP